ncbi:MAG: hypothetical protein LBQ65_06255 [Tannerellaceae bacterium]|jgi:hypothetical protein|nr:hypothetical protein [Tannerellaceae bacterium]
MEHKQQNPLLEGVYGLKQIGMPPRADVNSSSAASWFHSSEWELAAGDDTLARHVYNYLSLSNALDIDGAPIAATALWFQGLGSLADREAHCVLTKDCTLQIYRSYQPWGYDVTFNVELYISGHVLTDGVCKCRRLNDWQNKVAALHQITQPCLRSMLLARRFVVLMKRR